MADGLLNKASIILTPTGYKAGTLYNVAPIDEPYEDFDFARTSTATRINSSGLVSNVATGVPRISYDSNGDNGHILLEPTSTNLITYSEDLTQSAWAKTNATASTSTVINPQGTSNASLYVCGNFTGSNQFFRINPNTTYSNDVNFTYSMFVKYNSFQFCKLSYMNYSNLEHFASVFDIINGTVTTTNSNGTPQNTYSNIQDFGNGWFRISISAALSSSSGDAMNFEFNKAPSGTPTFSVYGRTDQTTTTNDKVYIWGAQLEELSYATSYIPTLTGSTETRATETATGAGSADLINSTEGVLYAEIARAENDTNAGIISLNDGSNSNLVSIYYFSNDKIAFDILSSSPSLSLSVTTSNTSNFNKIALKYKSGDIALWVNGVEVITRTETISLSGLNNLDFRYGGTTQPFYGKVKSVAVFNEALSDDELNNLTG